MDQAGKAAGDELHTKPARRGEMFAIAFPDAARMAQEHPINHVILSG